MSQHRSTEPSQAGRCKFAHMWCAATCATRPFSYRSRQFNMLHNVTGACETCDNQPSTSHSLGRVDFASDCEVYGRHARPDEDVRLGASTCRRLLEERLPARGSPRRQLRQRNACRRACSRHHSSFLHSGFGGFCYGRQRHVSAVLVFSTASQHVGCVEDRQCGCCARAKLC